jgi:hypothetical protein
MTLRGMTQRRAARAVTCTGADLALALALASTIPGCAAIVEPSDPAEAAHAYVDDPAVRRRALEASVAVADTPYADLRLAHYALVGAGIDDHERDWDALPPFALAVRPLRLRDHPPGAAGEIASLDRLTTRDDWERVGAEAFTRIPTQIDLGLDPLRDREIAERVGLSIDEASGEVSGAVEVETPAGWVVALTCSACHAAERDGSLVPGLANERLALGEVLGTPWPIGTVDVTADGVDNPVRPSDLRAIVHQERLHHTGNLGNGRIARMIRIETLLITQHGARARPDRRLVAAIALYLESLTDTLPALDRESEGGRLFAAECGRCHAGEGLAGGPVPIEMVLTDPRATIAGSERSTLGYRAPSLRGVADRRALLHDGTALDLDAILGLAVSSHRGHPFGRDLDDPSRRAIAHFLAAR